MKNEKLSETIEKIETILTEADLAGCILLFDAEESVHFVQASPSWTCLKMLIRKGNSAAIQFVTASDRYESEEARVETLSTTACLLAMMTHRLKEMLQKVDMLKSTFARSIGMDAKEVFKNTNIK